MSAATPATNKHSAAKSVGPYARLRRSISEAAPTPPSILTDTPFASQAPPEPWTWRDMATTKAASKPCSVDTIGEATSARFRVPDISKLHPAVANFYNEHKPVLNYAHLAVLLRDYPDGAFIVYVAQHGINISDPRYSCSPFHDTNSRSVVTYAEAMLKITENNLATCRYFMPPGDLRSAHIHQMACNYKPAHDKYRDIHNLSSPRGNNINDCTRFIGFRWCRMDDLASRIKPNSWGCRFDVTDYYRHFAVSPEDWPLLACKLPIVKGGPCVELWDTRMPFGFRPAVEVAHRMTTAMVYAINQRGITNVFATLDDFFKLDSGCNAKPPDDAFSQIRAVIEKDFGFPLNMKPHKTHSWKQIVEWDGWVWDLLNATVAMEPGKRAALLDELRDLQGKLRLTAKAVMHISGKLVWASTVVWGGRTFSQAWQDAAAKAGGMQPYHSLAINSAMRQAIEWWLASIHAYDGKRVVLGACASDITVATDATGHGGIGIYIDKSHYIGMTGPEVREAYPDMAPPADALIYIHESFALYLACRLYGHLMCNRYVHFITDNPTTARTAKFLSHRVPELHTIAKSIFTLADRHNFRFHDISLVPGKQNQLADALSRQQYKRFHDLMNDTPSDKEETVMKQEKGDAYEA